MTRVSYLLLFGLFMGYGTELAHATVHPLDSQTVSFEDTVTPDHHCALCVFLSHNRRKRIDFVFSRLALCDRPVSNFLLKKEVLALPFSIPKLYLLAPKNSPPS